MNVRFRSRLPWAMAFSFGRAIQQPALEIWGGHADHTSSAQRALAHRAWCNRAARRGEYSPEMEAASDGLGKGERTPDRLGQQAHWSDAP